MAKKMMGNKKGYGMNGMKKMNGMKMTNLSMNEGYLMPKIKVPNKQSCAVAPAYQNTGDNGMGNVITGHDLRSRGKSK